MALPIYKKGQGTLARLLGGALLGLFCFFAGTEMHNLTSNFFRFSEAVGTVLGIVTFVVLAGFSIYYVMISPKSSDYLIETELEMRKVNWPDRKEVVSSTGVVIGCVIVLAVYISLNDLVFGFLVEQLRIY